MSAKELEGKGLSRTEELATNGYVHIPKVISEQAIADAVSEIQTAFATEKKESKGTYSRINSEREQVKFGRTIDQLGSGLQHVVRTLAARWGELAPSEVRGVPVMDVYALRTSADEDKDEARAAQKWHVDHYSKFPVAALILCGTAATEFHAGPYADLASGKTELELEEWTDDWRRGKMTASSSFEELRHWTERMKDAGLVAEVQDVGLPAEAEADTDSAAATEACTDSGGDLKLVCDWDRPAASLQACSPGDGFFFWSNKVHRGPATSLGEERLVLFVSWSAWMDRKKKKKRESAPSSGGRAVLAARAPSLTDYSYYVEHLEPKLSLTPRAQRDHLRCLKRQRHPERPPLDNTSPHT